MIRLYCEMVRAVSGCIVPLLGLKFLFLHNDIIKCYILGSFSGSLVLGCIFQLHEGHRIDHAADHQ